LVTIDIPIIFYRSTESRYGDDAIDTSEIGKPKKVYSQMLLSSKNEGLLCVADPIFEENKQVNLNKDYNKFDK
jgi:hypothetical protein